MKCIVVVHPLHPTASNRADRNCRTQAHFGVGHRTAVDSRRRASAVFSHSALIVAARRQPSVGWGAMHKAGGGHHLEARSCRPIVVLDIEYRHRKRLRYDTDGRKTKIGTIFHASSSVGYRYRNRVDTLPIDKKQNSIRFRYLIHRSFRSASA